MREVAAEADERAHGNPLIRTRRALLGAAGLAARRCVAVSFRAALAAAAARAAALLRRLVGLEHRLALLVRRVLETRPPVDQRTRRLAAFGAKREEIVGGAK